MTQIAILASITLILLFVGANWAMIRFFRQSAEEEARNSEPLAEVGPPEHHMCRCVAVPSESTGRWGRDDKGVYWDTSGDESARPAHTEKTPKYLWPYLSTKDVAQPAIPCTYVHENGIDEL
jgi:hypothetical protein